jgi:hypothetical protein
MAGQKELRKKEKKTKVAPKRESKIWTSIKIVLYAMSWLALAAMYSPLSQLTLAPVYGSIPAYFFRPKAMLFTALIAFMGRSHLKSFLSTNSRRFISPFCFFIPPIQLFLCRFSSQLGPIYGPLLTEVLTYYPLLLLSLHTAVESLEGLDLGDSALQASEIAPVLASYMTFSFLEKASSALARQLIGYHKVFMTSNLQLTLASLYLLLAPSAYVSFAVPAIYHTIQMDPHHLSGAGLEVANTHLNPFNFTILDRRQSVTGYISVLKNVAEDMVVLRCDHSLLGGEFLVNPERQAQGMTVREPIYGVFSMLEAVRLVETQSSKKDEEKKALVM